jgi:hypothetical protein
MRLSIIAVVGFVFLAVMFSAIFYITLALITISIMVCFPVLVGFLWGGHETRRFLISSSASSDSGNRDSSHGPVSVQIEGRKFLISELPLRLEFTVACRNLVVLAAITLIAIASVSACILSGAATQRLEMDSPRYLLLYGLCFLIGVLIFPAWLWLTECWLLKSPGITLAAIHSRGRGGLGASWVSYGVTDPRGGHHGGSVMDFGGPKGDDFKIVLCNPLNPGLNKLSCGFLFHRLTWAEGQ